jgi:hypothetical protein
MRDSEERDRSFREALVHRVDLAAGAARIMQVTEGPDGPLRARRILELQLDAGPKGIGEWVYRKAVGTLHASGHRDEAAALRRVADTGSVLAAAEQEWHGRYLGRPPTEDERTTAVFRDRGIVRPGGSPVRGADGALYQDSSIAGENGNRASVTVIGHAGASETVGFRNTGDRDDWYATRMTEGRLEDGPIPMWTGDDRLPDCRTVREERVIACLLRGGPLDAETHAQLKAQTFTTHARAEIYLAWLACRPAAEGQQPGNVREELARRLLRAPAFAAPYVGWPFGHQTLAYYDRLKASPSGEPRAKEAAWTLLTQDAHAVAVALRAHPGAVRTSASARQVPHPRSGEMPDARWRIPPQRRPDDPSPGPAPHL